MPYNPSSDFVGLWRAISGGVEKAEMPGMDFVIQALHRAGLLRVVNSQTAPIVNQSTTAWFKPLPSSFSGEGSLFLWDASLNMYVPATPELYHATLTAGVDGGGGGGDGVPEAPTDDFTYGRINAEWVRIPGEADNDGRQYGRQSKSWTHIAGSGVIDPGPGDGGGTGDTEMAIVQNAPPSNPTAGMMWWDDDDNMLRVYDGLQWNTVGPSLGPSGQPISTSALTFAMTQPTALTLAGATWTVIPYTSTPQIDTQAGQWEPITKKLTPKKAGMYMFNLRAAPTTAGGVAILKNDDGVFNSQASDIVLALSATGTQVWQSISGVSPMNGTTDYVRAFAYSTVNSLIVAGSNPVWNALLLP
jgi:hypothetical protein